MPEQFKISWVDSGREPQCEPNPAYPNGKDIHAPADAEQTCMVKLPYPAKRCGLYVVRCEKCGMSVGITTAGRPDDPRSIVLECFHAV